MIKVSVAIPARNEQATISPLIESLLAQTCPADEIVVADGGSTDATVSILRRYESRGVRVLEIGPAFPGRGRNAAIEAARNEWIALIDAGCRADPGWIEALLRPLSSTAASDPVPAVVYGTCRPRLDGEWAVAQALAFLAPRDPLTGEAAPVIASALVHRSAWRKAGRFPEHLRAAEDLLFLRRLAATGLLSAQSPDAVVSWTLPGSPGAVFRRFRLYSRHHLAAGLFQTWHLRVMAMDAAALLVAVLAVCAFAAGSAFAWLPIVGALAAGAVTRLLRTVARRQAYVEGEAFRLDRLLRVAWLLCLADAATWAGAFDHLRSGRRTPDAASEPPG